MNPRWRRFLLLLTIIACVLVHAPRLHQMHAKAVAVSQAVNAPLALPIVKAKTAAPRVTLQLKPWTFDAAAASQLEPQDLTLYLAKQQISPPTQADIDAISQDLTFFSETEFAPPQTSRAAVRSSSPVVQLASLPPVDFRPRRAQRIAVVANYVRPVIANSFEYDFAMRFKLPVQSTNHVRHPQTDGDGSTGAVGGDSSPPHVSDDDGSDTGSTVDVGDPGMGGVGSGVGGFPPPTGNSVPEPSVLLPLICIGTLLRRPKRNS